MKIHIVQKGDTLWKIAKKYGVNFEELKKMNSQLSNPDMIMPGMKVKVPTSGGMVKKETPKMGSNPGAPISLGTKKEMPIAEHPFAKEKPVPQPIKEAPVKEAPMQPILKEAPKAPYIPKMPQPVVPEIDINNYYMLNMANMSVQQPQQQPQLPPAPAPILPAKEVPIKPESPESPIQMPIQGGVEQPMYPQYCVPISPVMPGPGFNYPWGYPQQPAMPYAPLQGAMMAPSPGMVPANPGMMGANPGAMPAYPSGGPGYYHSDESSSFMPQMPQQMQMPPQQMQMMPQQMQMPPQQMQMMPQQMQMPPQQMQMMPQQMPMMGEQMYYPRMEKGKKEAPIFKQEIIQAPIIQPAPQPIQAPIMQPAPAPVPAPQPMPLPQPMPVQMPIAQVPYVPYPDCCYPVSPIMPGPGFGNPGMGYPYGQMPYNYPQMGSYPQVPGAMESMESSNIQMGYPQMGGQMPMGVNPQMAGMPANPDCGCGPQVYAPPYSGQMGQPPLINPYGMGPMGTSPYGMPRYHDEGSEFDD